MLIGGTLISSVELHGQISLVIFMAKCPLRCKFCHNSEILEDGTYIDLEGIKKIIDSSKDFIDAIVLSGGEPLVQLDDIINILKYAKSLNLKTKIDTSGVYPDRLKKILDLCLLDFVSMDIKAPFYKYKKITSADVGIDVRKAMLLVNDYRDVKFETRTTFVPKLLNKKDIIDIAENITSDIFTIQQFRNKNVLDESLKNIESPNPNDLKELAILLKPIFKGKIKVKTSEFGEEEV